MLGTKVKGAGGAKNLETENVKAIVPDKKAKKALNIPAPVIEEMEMESGEEDDFRAEQRNEVMVEIPHDILTVQAGGEAGAVEALSATFLQESSVWQDGDGTG